MINILVTGVGSLLGQGIIKCIKQSDIEFNIIGTDYFNTAVGLYWVDKPYLLPDFLKKEVTEEEWVDEVINIIIKNNIEYLIPGLDFELPLLSKNKNKIESNSNVKIIISDEEIIRIGNDKWETYKYLKENNFMCPESCLPESFNEFKKNHNYPLIIKPRYGHTSKNVFLVNNDTEALKCLKICELPIIQEYLEEDDLEYTCGSVFINGQVQSVISLKRQLKNGNTSYAINDCNQALNEYIRDLTSKLKPFGPINYQLRISKNGPSIFEINPRFSGTTPLRMIFNVNEIDAVIKPLLNLNFNYKEKSGVVIRYLEDEYITLNQFNSLHG